MKKIDKILKYVDNEGISFSKFERKSGLGASYLTKTRDRDVDITNKVLEKIKKHNPEDFYKIFPEEKNEGNELSQPIVSINTNAQTQLHVDLLNKQIKQLEAHCAFVEKMYEQKLTEIAANFQKALANQETMLRQIAAESYLAARRYAGKDDEKFQEELRNLGILVSTGR